MKKIFLLSLIICYLPSIITILLIILNHDEKNVDDTIIVDELFNIINIIMWTSIYCIQFKNAYQLYIIFFIFTFIGCITIYFTCIQFSILSILTNINFINSCGLLIGLYIYKKIINNRTTQPLETPLLTEVY